MTRTQQSHAPDTVVSETLSDMLRKYSDMLTAAKMGMAYRDTQIAAAAVLIVAQLMREIDKKATQNAAKVAPDEVSEIWGKALQQFAEKRVIP